MSETPVLIGIAQIEQRCDDPLAAREPLALMIEAARAAAEDAGNPALLGAVGSVRVVRGIWPYKNPARVIAEAIGVPGAETALTQFGGNFVQTAVNQAAADIQAGRQEIILVTGAECGNTQAKARRAGLDLRSKLNWQPAPGQPEVMIGADVPMVDEIEAAVGLMQPIQIYPMFENALRHHLGESIDAHQKKISELWARFSAVAAANPHAWIREPRSAEEIRTISDFNRPVSFPYPKLMNSNNNVDQAAALILCSAARARALGIPEDKWVYPWAGTDAHDAYVFSQRDNFYESPAIRVAGGRVLEACDLAPADVDLVDVYSCFPVAVQVGAREIGLDLDRPLTVTGGLTFAGGPLNNYVMHSIARMAELLREDRNARGLITANGGYLTKHAFGVYSATPPEKPFQHQDVQAEVDRFPLRRAVASHEGPATVESYTVMYGGDAPRIAYVSALLDDGQRTLASTEDADVMAAMTREEFCGRSVKLSDNRA
ncbi:MAG TPA: acetyl-CoA acetyltransferase, partial [Pseudomonadales bacterium]